MTEDPGSKAKGHATRMFAWEDQVARDIHLKSVPHALHVVVILRRNMNRSGHSKAEHKWLAQQIGVSDRTIRYSISMLQKRGHLKVLSGKAGRRANTYIAVVASDVGSTVPTSKTTAMDYRVDGNSTSGSVGNGVPTRIHFPPLSYSDRSARRPSAMPNRGRFELELAKRIGVDGWPILDQLEDAEVIDLCTRQRQGTLDDPALLAICAAVRQRKLASIEPGKQDRSPEVGKTQNVANDPRQLNLNRR